MNNKKTTRLNKSSIKKVKIVTTSLFKKVKIVTILMYLRSKRKIKTKTKRMENKNDFLNSKILIL